MSVYIEKTATVINVDASESAKIWKNVYLKDCKLKAQVNIGDFTRAENSIFEDNVSIQRNALIYSSSVGRYSYTGKNLTMWHAEIGSFCSISWNVGIGGANHDYKRLTTHAFLYSPHMGLMDENTPGYDRFSAPCKVGSDVWIGANAIINRGVTVGDGAVIGAGAVVVEDVEPYAIVVGVPAVPLKKRFDDRTIERLLKIRWWEFSDDLIRKNFVLFNSQPTEEVLEKLESIKKR